MKNIYIDDKVLVDHSHIAIVTGVFINNKNKERNLKVRFVFDSSCIVFKKTTMIVNERDVLLLKDKVD